MDLLVGATGTVGKYVLDHYAGRKDVWVFAHSERSEQFARGKGIGQVFSGDDRDPQSLIEAFQEVDRLFLLTPPALEQPQVELRFLKAVKLESKGSSTFRCSIREAGPILKSRLSTNLQKNGSQRPEYLMSLFNHRLS